MIDNKKNGEIAPFSHVVSSIKILFEQKKVNFSKKLIKK